MLARRLVVAGKVKPGMAGTRQQARLRAGHAYVSGAVRPCMYLNKILNQPLVCRPL